MFHHVEKVQDEFRVSFTKGAWHEFFKKSNDHVSTEEPVYCFTSVFAPFALQTTIYHHWQHRASDAVEKFSTTDRIPISISGGRERGYRSYTTKQHLDSGEWRVDVETEDGRIIGRIHFLATSLADETRALRTIIF